MPDDEINAEAQGGAGNEQPQSAADNDIPEGFGKAEKIEDILAEAARPRDKSAYEQIMEEERRKANSRREILEARDKAHVAMVEKAFAEDCKVPVSIGTTVYFDSAERPPQKPTARMSSEYFLRVVEPYEWKINEGETVYVNTGTYGFNQQFFKAVHSFVALTKGEFPIMLYDITLRNTAKHGLALTNRFLHVSLKDYLPFKIRISKVQRIETRFGYDVVDWNTLYIKQRGIKSMIPVFRTTDPERLVELADVLMKMFYYLSPKTPDISFSVMGKMPIPPEDDPGKPMNLWQLIRKILNFKKSYNSPDRVWTADYTNRLRSIAYAAAGTTSEEDDKAEEAKQAEADGVHTDDDKDQKDKDKKDKKSKDSKDKKDKDKKDKKDKKESKDKGKKESGDKKSKDKGDKKDKKDKGGKKKK